MKPDTFLVVTHGIDSSETHNELRENLGWSGGYTYDVIDVNRASTIVMEVKPNTAAVADLVEGGLILWAPKAGTHLVGWRRIPNPERNDIRDRAITALTKAIQMNTPVRVSEAIDAIAEMVKNDLRS